MSYVCEDNRCPKCGVELKRNKYNQLFCPNHGVFDIEKESEEDKKECSYVG